MKVNVWFGPDNIVVAQAHNNGVVIFNIAGSVDDVCASLNAEYMAIEERREALKTALARILYSPISWD